MLALVCLIQNINVFSCCKSKRNPQLKESKCKSLRKCSIISFEETAMLMKWFKKRDMKNRLTIATNHVAVSRTAWCCSAILMVGVNYNVVSYSSRSCTIASSLYIRRGGAAEQSIFKMALRILRSRTWRSQAGYWFLQRSSLMTVSSRRAARDEGVDATGCLTWNTGIQLSRSVYFPLSRSKVAVAPRLERSEFVAPSEGSVENGAVGSRSSPCPLAERPKRAPLGWKKA